MKRRNFFKASVVSLSLAVAGLVAVPGLYHALGHAKIGRIGSRKM